MGSDIPNGVNKSMSDADYATWKDLQDLAAESMARLEIGRGAGDEGWALLARRSVVLQEMATAFAKESLTDRPAISSSM